MSNYSQKHGTAECAYTGCDEVAAKLEVHNGRLDWFCERHTHD